MTVNWGSIVNSTTQTQLANALHPLIGHEIVNLRIPIDVAEQFEPSQIGTIIGTLTDALLPNIALSKGVGLTKASGILGDREGYPDFIHHAGYRLELKGLFKDNPDVKLKKPPTRREPSARLTQKVTFSNVVADTDALLILVYELAKSSSDENLLSPFIVDLGIFPVIECIGARDHRLVKRGGKWFGSQLQPHQTPVVISKAGKRALASNEALNIEQYGRKESEGHHFNEDTNFGKLKRIPYKPLHEFLQKNGASYSSTGDYPAQWKIPRLDGDTLVDESTNED